MGHNIATDKSWEWNQECLGKKLITPWYDIVSSLTFGILPIYQEWAKKKIIQSQLTIYKPVFQESSTEKLKSQQYLSSWFTPYMVK